MGKHNMDGPRKMNNSEQSILYESRNVFQRDDAISPNTYVTIAICSALIPAALLGICFAFKKEMKLFP